MMDELVCRHLPNDVQVMVGEKHQQASYGRSCLRSSESQAVQSKQVEQHDLEKSTSDMCSQEAPQLCFRTHMFVLGSVCCTSRESLLGRHFVMPPPPRFCPAHHIRNKPHCPTWFHAAGGSYCLACLRAGYISYTSLFIHFI